MENESTSKNKDFHVVPSYNVLTKGICAKRNLARESEVMFL
jgi:hypothetical protein